ncbi:unnamed protein product, partial [Polarella glacialis]
EIAKVIPYFPYKKLDRFSDIGGILKHPKLFDAMCSVMAKRYRKLGATKILGFEARGCLFTPVAIKLGVPFVMLRVDEMCLQKGALVPGDGVILIDDLIATGGTLCAGIELVKACGAEVVCMIELKALRGRDRCLKAGAKDVWGFISEEILGEAAPLPDDYVDDGKH